MITNDIEIQKQIDHQKMTAKGQICGCEIKCDKIYFGINAYGIIFYPQCEIGFSYCYGSSFSENRIGRLELKNLNIENVNVILLYLMKNELKIRRRNQNENRTS